MNSKNISGFSTVRYITPERAGSLTFEGGIESQIRTNEEWLPSQRTKNQTSNFKQQSVSIFSKLRTNILQLFHDTRSEEFRFEPILESINGLLDHVEIRLTESSFGFYSKLSGDYIPPDSVSSGESELTALAIEVLEFVYSNKQEQALLLLDEPDVHIHPDLQRRFINFLVASLKKYPCQAIVSTHSASILSAASEFEDSRICFIEAQQKAFEFRAFDQTIKRTIPAFGSHLISRIFRDSPVLLVEGEDDARIWSAATRSSAGKVNFFPVVAGDKSELSRLEKECATILPAIYDSPVCFSLRDGDGVEGDLDNNGTVIKLRLACYAAENLLLCDDTLVYCNSSTEQFKNVIEQWIAKNPKHSRVNETKVFLQDFDHRRTLKIKALRELILEWMNVKKPWEVLLGQVIANVVTRNEYLNSKHSMIEYLGPKVVKALGIGINETDSVISH
jgi:hypothetical protein